MSSRVASRFRPALRRGATRFAPNAAALVKAVLPGPQVLRELPGKRTKLTTAMMAWLPAMLLLAPGPASGAMSWEQKAPATSPSARSRFAMTWDKVHRQVVLFGGDDGR